MLSVYYLYTLDYYHNELKPVFLSFNELLQRSYDKDSWQGKINLNSKASRLKSSITLGKRTAWNKSSDFSLFKNGDDLTVSKT